MKLPCNRVHHVAISGQLSIFPIHHYWKRSEPVKCSLIQGLQSHSGRAISFHNLVCAGRESTGSQPDQTIIPSTRSTAASTMFACNIHFLIVLATTNTFLQRHSTESHISNVTNKPNNSSRYNSLYFQSQLVWLYVKQAVTLDVE